VYRAPISCLSCKQGLVAFSTTEAEYIACSNATREVEWLARLHKDVTSETVVPTIYCDSNGTLKTIYSRVSSPKTKHIDILYHISPDQQECGIVNFTDISTDDNLADIMTKALGPAKHLHFATGIGLWAEKMGVKWVFGSPGQAKGQGKVERAIRSVKTSIRRMAKEKPTVWITLVPDAQLAFKTHYPYSENGHSPSTLLLGFTPRNKVLNLIEPAQTNKILANPRGHKEMMKQLQEIRLAKLDAVHQEAVSMQIDHRARRITNHEQGLRRHHYVIGDLVLYQNYQLKTQHGNPWTYHWKGPVEIVHITAKGKLHLRHPETNELMKAWHTDKVRPVILRKASVVLEDASDSENL